MLKETEFTKMERYHQQVRTAQIVEIVPDRSMTFRSVLPSGKPEYERVNVADTSNLDVGTWIDFCKRPTGTSGYTMTIFGLTPQRYIPAEE